MDDYVLMWTFVILLLHYWFLCFRQWYLSDAIFSCHDSKRLSRDWSSMFWSVSYHHDQCNYNDTVESSHRHFDSFKGTLCQRTQWGICDIKNTRYRWKICVEYSASQDVCLVSSSSSNWRFSIQAIFFVFSLIPCSSMKIGNPLVLIISCFIYFHAYLETYKNIRILLRKMILIILERWFWKKIWIHVRRSNFSARLYILLLIWLYLDDKTKNHDQQNNIDIDIHITYLFCLKSISNDWGNDKYDAVTSKQHTTLIEHIRPISFCQQQKSGLYIEIRLSSPNYITYVSDKFDHWNFFERSTSRTSGIDWIEDNDCSMTFDIHSFWIHSWKHQQMNAESLNSKYFEYALRLFHRFQKLPAPTSNWSPLFFIWFRMRTLYWFTR